MCGQLNYQIMGDQSYKIPESTLSKASEPVETYQREIVNYSTSDPWNPNVPFHGTQKEWWDHFHEIEESCFSSISESHQRVSQWLDNQKK